MIKIDETFVVACAFTAFFAILLIGGRGLLKNIGKALDARSARIENELEEALKLKEEAQAVLATYQRNQRKAIEEVEEILSNARSEADLITQQARASLEQELNKRTEVAMEKIRQTESRVVDEIRNSTVDIVMTTARTVILENLGKDAADEMITKAITDIGRKLH
jgi:F-type H+-transporting ATPase subunit b